jgi:putative flippase GtrA
MFKFLIQATKYAAASAIALAVDYCVLLALTHYAGWHYLWANTVSFLSGAIVAYLLSVQFVFKAHRLHSRRLEIFVFVVIGVVGYGVSQLVLFITVGKLGFDLVVAKGAAACCSFVANFLLRRQLLFHIAAAPA